MNRNRNAKPSFVERIVGSTHSVWHCHAFGAAVATLGVFAVGAVWSMGMSDPHPPMINGSAINLHEAANIVSEEARLLERFELSQKTKSELDARSRDIGKWLRTDVDADEQTGIIRSLADQSQLQLVSIAVGDSHHGIRVSAMNIDCVVQGSFSSLCNFLSLLPQQPVPIDCSKISVSRRTDLEETVGCSVRLSLLVPFASPMTAGGKLISSNGTIAEATEDAR